MLLGSQTGLAIQNLHDYLQNVRFKIRIFDKLNSADVR